MHDVCTKCGMPFMAGDADRYNAQRDEKPYHQQCLPDGDEWAWPLSRRSPVSKRRVKKSNLIRKIGPTKGKAQKVSSGTPEIQNAKVTSSRKRAR